MTATPATGNCGSGFSDCGGADGGEDISDYVDGYGCGWGGAWGCGDADGAVGCIHRRDAEGTEKVFLLEWGVDFMSALFSLRHIFLVLRHGDGARGEVGSSSVRLPCFARLQRALRRPST